jgi:hypothetical protein
VFEFSEGRPEGVDLGECQAVRLDVELPRDRQERLAAEEILREVDLALWGARQVGKIEGRHPKQCPRLSGGEALMIGVLTQKKVVLVERLDVPVFAAREMLNRQYHDFLCSLVDRVIDKIAVSGRHELADALDILGTTDPRKKCQVLKTAQDCILTASAADGLCVRRYSAISARSRVARGVYRSFTDQSGGKQPRLRHPWQIRVALLAQALRARPPNGPDRPAQPLPHSWPNEQQHARCHPGTPQVAGVQLQLPVPEAWSCVKDRNLAGTAKVGTAVPPRRSCTAPTKTLVLTTTLIRAAVALRCEPHRSAGRYPLFSLSETRPRRSGETRAPRQCASIPRVAGRSGEGIASRTLARPVT